MKRLRMKKRVACALVIVAMLTFQTTVPVEAANTLDPHNPSTFQKEGGESHTPGNVLTLTDQGIADFVAFFAADVDASPGTDIDVVATFQIRQTSLNNADTGNRVVINDGVTRSAIAACIVKDGVRGIGLKSQGQASDPASYPVFVPVDWQAAPVTIRFRRSANGDAELVEVNGVAPSPRALLTFDKAPPPTRTGFGSVEFGCTSPEAKTTVEYAAFRSERVVNPVEPTILTVNSLGDGPIDLTDGTVTLRDAIHAANNDLQVSPGGPTGSGAEEIQFEPSLSGTITLNQGQLGISSDLMITGPGAGIVTVNANGSSRVFDVSDSESAVSKVTISGLTISGGEDSSGVGGGGILNREDLTLQNCTVTGNHSNSGGGIFNAAALTVKNSTLSSNVAYSGEGGGIFNAGTLTLQDSTLNLNETRFDGGGAAILNSGTLTVQNSTLSGNFARVDGGGIKNLGTLTMQNSTLTQNSVGQHARGGGIFTSFPGTVALHNTIVATNYGFLYPPDDVNGSLASTSTNNLIGVDSGLTGISHGSNGNQLGTAASPINPGLGELADNGGTNITQTHALLTFSPAIDAGNNAQAMGMTTDQRGSPFVRIFNTTVDIGAYEVQSFSNSRVVDTTADEDDGDYSAGDLSLREAIRLSNGAAGADTITFSPSVFGTPQTIALGGTEMVIADELTLSGPGASLLTLSGNNASRVFNVRAVNGAGEYPVTLSGLTVTGGNAGPDDDDRGGGILHTGGMLTILNSTLIGNTAAHGGGIASFRYLAVLNCTISNNTAHFPFTSGPRGGGIYSQGWRLTVLDSTLIGNTAMFGNGGGIYALRTSELSVRNTTLNGNEAGSDGGGMYYQDDSVSTNVLIVENSTLSGNTAGRGGGGLFVSSDSFFPFTVKNSTLSGNRAGRGGGIFNGCEIFECDNYNPNLAARLIVQDSTLSNNAVGSSNGGGINSTRNGILTVRSSSLSANIGAGIVNQEGTVMVQSSTLNSNRVGGIRSRGTLTVVNSTLSGNTDEGGIVSGGSLTIQNSTITQNHTDSANSGGGIGVSNGTLTMHNTIVADNFRDDANTSRDDVSGLFESSSTNNLIGVDTGLTGISNGTNGNQLGTSVTLINPQLGLLANNGGATLTHALLAGSPAVNAGNNGGIPADTYDLDGDSNTSEPIPFDQRGNSFARVLDTTVDIGAFELRLDADNDGVPDTTDNCPQDSNPNQADGDGDGIGDVCDPNPNDGPTGDVDGDGVLNNADNCPTTPNADQTNTDGDAEGDACDADDDNDGVPDTADNCPLTSNSDQANHDGDAQGDVCDPDDDNDGVADNADNCPFVANPNQANNDGDALGDVCDPDDDNDGVADATDNCPLVANPNQANADGDALGDACDPTPNGDIQLVFSSNRDGNFEIYGMRADGTGVVRLTNERCCRSRPVPVAGQDQSPLQQQP